MKQLAVLVMLAIPLLAPSSAQAQRGGFGGGGMGGMGMGGSMPRFEPPELPGPELDGPPDTTAATKALTLKDDENGLLPFFIEWSKDSLHPSVDAPAGGRIDRFELASPRPDELKSVLSRLHLDATVANAPQPTLRADLTGPKGKLPLPASAQR